MMLDLLKGPTPVGSLGMGPVGRVIECDTSHDSS